MPDHKSYLIISRASPYGSHQARAALDLALTAAAFEEDVTLVFMGDGIWQLLDNQDTRCVELKNVGKMIPALEMYEVRQVLVHEESRQALGIDKEQLPADITVTDNNTLGKLINAADQVMVF